MVAIPVLSSLMPRSLQAQAVVIPPRYVFIGSTLGGLNDNSIYPAELPGNRTFFKPGADNPYDSANSVGDHYIHYAPIDTANPTGFSPLFDQKFNSYLDRALVLRGLDCREAADAPIVHSARPLLGHYFQQFKGDGKYDKTPTIDQIMAYSDGFYIDDPRIFRSINLAARFNSAGEKPILSYQFENPLAKSGDIVKAPHYSNPHQVFDLLFQAPPTIPANSITPVVDAVLADFNALRQNPKLSSEDKLKLESHIDLLAQFERVKTSTSLLIFDTPAALTPTSVDLPGGSNMSTTDFQTLHGLYNDLIVAAFSTGVSRLGTIELSVQDHSGSPDGTLWHHWSHNGPDPDLLEIYKGHVDGVLLDLISKMDAVVEANGKTMLDNSLVQYSMTASYTGHHPYSIPHVTFGSADGYFKTGQYIDLRNRDHSRRPGVLHNRWMVNVMKAMGLDRSQWDMTALGLLGETGTEGVKGYAQHWPESQTQFAFYLNQDADIEDDLPFVRP